MPCQHRVNSIISLCYRNVCTCSCMQFWLHDTKNASYLTKVHRNFRKAVWASYTLATERSIPLIPVNNISVEESYQRFCGAMQKATRHSIPRGFRPTYTLCSDEECQDLLQQYEESGDSDIAGHLTESLDVARRHR